MLAVRSQARPVDPEHNGSSVIARGVTGASSI
jgi:hypothetical protein